MNSVWIVDAKQPHIEATSLPIKLHNTTFKNFYPLKLKWQKMKKWNYN
jgi:hypothetical protein